MASMDATAFIAVLIVLLATTVVTAPLASEAQQAGKIARIGLLCATRCEGAGLDVLRAGFKEAVPGAKRVATLGNPTNDVYRVTFPVEIPPTARALGLRLQVLEVSEPGQIEGAIEAAVRERADALHVLGDPIFHSPPTRLPELAARARLPAIYISAELVRAGGLMSYGTNLPELSRRAATYVDRILKGAKPAELPVEQPKKFDLVINLRTAKALGLTIPPSLLLRADQVIE